jgi:hypothetical protein
MMSLRVATEEKRNSRIDEYAGGGPAGEREWRMFSFSGRLASQLGKGGQAVAALDADQRELIRLL